MTLLDRQALTKPGLLRVPQIIAVFWLIKALSTALGESTSDWLVSTIDPVIAVGLGFVAFVAALVWQFSRRRYVATSYWLAVVMVGVFGTMMADVMHVVLGLPYLVTTVLYAVVLGAVFYLWWRVEGTLSIHSIDTPRREVFYWLAVAATFAMGTAVGDLAAVTWQLGYDKSILLFAVLMLPPLIGWRIFTWNPILAFWWAYVMTRPLGASVADWLGKPVVAGGLGLGQGLVTAVFALAIAALVAHLAKTRLDVQPAQPSAPDRSSPTR